jgi:Uncharacterised protein family (UPF0236)
VQRVFQDIGQKGHVDLEASEMAIRAASHRIGGRLLEKLLNADEGGYQGSCLDCGQGHSARFVEYRRKRLVTVLTPVEVGRAYYHCDRCGEGIIPKDRELDIVDTGFSPGVRRMMGQVGGKEAFEDGRKDLELLAGLALTTKAVERVAEAIGEQIEQQNQREQKQILLGKVVPFVGRATIPNLYVAIDGSGVPVVARETEGRQGKDETGQAKTREAKLGCVFTQTMVDDQGYAVRDEESTTYVGAIETAECFGRRVYAEAVRRGITCARKVIVLADGAKWIWGIAAEHFPGAIEIVDLYHAREHLAKVAKLVYGVKTPKSQEWISARRDELDDGDVRAVVAALGRLRLRDKGIQKEVRTEMKYFRRNAERMRYAEFRSQGLFVGSGVVEAGCKTIFGQRLKLSGMHWTVRGANAIIALRCCQLSALWEEFWESRATG